LLPSFRTFAATYPNTPKTDKLPNQHTARLINLALLSPFNKYHKSILCPKSTPNELFEWFTSHHTSNQIFTLQLTAKQDKITIG